ncbi:MAG: FHA domain-containing protein [Myxococcales bacterium]|nr:FHA domain-containing protein [Myxococcales bacterium]
MSSDPNKKSPRTFQCRDVLWDTFEQMARELECSVDYLINESMKQDSRQRNYGERAPMREPPSRDPGYASAPPPPPMPARGTIPPTPAGRLPPPPMPRGGGAGMPPPPPRHPTLNPSRQPPPLGGGAGPGGGLPMPPPPRGQQPPAYPRNPPPPVERERERPPPPREARDPGPPPGRSNGFGPQGASLSVMYQGEKWAVNKDRFVIGRGRQSSDLTLKDPNVSRQHAMVEYQNGVYFIVDMGSTNGVEYNGQRIARKQIAEGDVFRICDHDLRFTFR